MRLNIKNVIKYSLSIFLTASKYNEYYDIDGKIKKLRDHNAHR